MSGVTLKSLKVKLFTDGADKAQIVAMAREHVGPSLDCNLLIQFVFERS